MNSADYGYSDIRSAQSSSLYSAKAKQLSLRIKISSHLFSFPTLFSSHVHFSLQTEISFRSSYQIAPQTQLSPKTENHEQLLPILGTPSACTQADFTNHLSPILLVAETQTSTTRQFSSKLFHSDQLAPDLIYVNPEGYQ
ncbi:hypothetical protein F511_16409 [Dorcoceras hygrometricum]|uniref:Uncharacterized protein n=1 Tax=Dorcoceras hygrometricum TaxID=472368 RepID=A0A2Z7CIT2_9LAMI|nr:hypothetical protein F511_16409 [Dorcoceras hygrometricum]